jgi:hypothetical protein
MPVELDPDMAREDGGLRFRVALVGFPAASTGGYTGDGDRTHGEMGLAQHDDVIEALAADGADDPFDEGVLPGCPRGNDHLSNPHVGDGPGEALAVDGIPIAE